MIPTIVVLRYILSLPVRLLLTLFGVFWWAYGADVNFREMWTLPRRRFGQ